VRGFAGVSQFAAYWYAVAVPGYFSQRELDIRAIKLATYGKRLVFVLVLMLLIGLPLGYNVFSYEMAHMFSRTTPVWITIESAVANTFCFVGMLGLILLVAYWLLALVAKTSLSSK
jgi:hypothetical protein